jgi:hypothetical protein
VRGDWQDPTANATGRFTELYGSWTVSDHAQVSFGRQNFQWGPAETLSPSNRIFHVRGYELNATSVVEGRDLARLNLSFGQVLSVIALVEFQDNGESPFVAGAPFEEKGLAKAEVASKNGLAYLGVVGGLIGDRGWVGEYGSVEPLPGFSLYADVSHERGSQAWYPVAGLPVATFAQDRVDDEAVQTLAVAGMRYAFAGGEDVRVEGVYDQAGYDLDDMKLAATVVRDLVATVPEVVGPYLSPGLELGGQQYVYASTLVPDVGPGERLTVQARYLHSLTSSTGGAFVNVQAIGSDALLLFGSLGWFHGAEDRDLTRLARGSLLLGARYTW